MKIQTTAVRLVPNVVRARFSRYRTSFCHSSWTINTISVALLFQLYKKKKMKNSMMEIETRAVEGRTGCRLRVKDRAVFVFVFSFCLASWLLITVKFNTNVQFVSPEMLSTLFFFITSTLSENRRQRSCDVHAPCSFKVLGLSKQLFFLLSQAVVYVWDFLLLHDWMTFFSSSKARYSEQITVWTTHFYC